jgi:hypothetical protein
MLTFSKTALELLVNLRDLEPLIEVVVEVVTLDEETE